MWRGQSFTYGVNNENYEVNLDTTQLHHVAIVYDDNDNKLTFWVNGRLENTVKNAISGVPTRVRLGAKEYGIVSLYNRALNKHEVIQHFVDNHVMNFTDDEVLVN